MIDIIYDRKAKQYQWTEPESGTVLTAASKQEKPALFKAAVALLDPDLYAASIRMIERHPQLERVVWRGTELICEGKVEVFATAQGNVIAKVESSDGYGRYAIEQLEHGMTCQCENFTSFAAPITETGQSMCKHLTAVKLWQYAREERF